MFFANFQEFNHYLGVEKPISEKIDFGVYGIEKNLRKYSENVSVDFYRISLKENISYKSGDNIHHAQDLIFFNSPKQEFQWDIENNWTGFYINISKETIDKHRFIFKNCLEYGQHEALLISPNQSKELKQIFSLLYQNYDENNYDESIVLSYANIIISLVEKYYYQQFLNNKKQYNHLVSQFQLLLENYYQNPEQQLLTVRTIASKMNVSANYLGDIIKIYTQKSASEHIQEKIMEKAKDLLKDTKLSVSEIAYFLGYDYPNYFAKFFKKHFGKSPKEFRNTHDNGGRN